MEIYARAREFMAANGNPRQWGQSHWPPEALIARDIERGKCYVCEADGLLQGVFYYDFSPGRGAGLPQHRRGRLGL